MVEQELLDRIYNQIQHKHEEREMTIKKLLEDCNKSVKEYITKAAQPSEKIHKIIEQNVVVMFLGSRMEAANKVYFKHNFIHKNMHTVIVR